MLHWAFTFLVVALISAVFGFGALAAVSVEIARMLFGVFIILFVITAAIHIARGRAPPL